MRRCDPAMLCIGETLLRLVAALLFAVVFVVTSCHIAHAGSASTLPAVVADIQSFRGHIAYSGRRTDGPEQSVAGSLSVDSGGWTLEERNAQTLLHVSNAGSWLRAGSQTFAFDDPFEVEALVNSWAALLGSSLGATIAPDATVPSWSVDHDARVYVNSAQTEVVGVVDTRSADGISFAYNDWVSVNGVRLPQAIVRMRGGVTVASFSINSYQVEWASKDNSITSQAASGAVLPTQSPVVDRAVSGAVIPQALRRFGMLFSLLFLGLGFVAWARRDALSDRLCKRVADDPRAWRQEGTNVFVSPEGIMSFQGRPYHVGPLFYSRTTTVQSSVLFIRVSAPGVSRSLIMARKFPRPAIFHKATNPAAGFTLVEALTSAALFSVVIVCAAFPALIALAQADRVAAQHQLANEIAANALADEEAALAYGTIDDTSATSTVDGLALIVTVTPAAVSGLHNVVVQVADPSGHALARIATMIGPPVPAPGASAPPG